MNFEELLAFAERHPYLSLALAGLTIALVYNEIARLFRSYKVLQPAGLTALINRENALVVDLSSISEFEKGHIPGSRNVVQSQFDPENKQLAGAKAMPVVAVCRTGQASAAAAKRLKQAGFEQVPRGGLGWFGAPHAIAGLRANAEPRRSAPRQVRSAPGTRAES